MESGGGIYPGHVYMEYYANLGSRSFIGCIFCYLSGMFVILPVAFIYIFFI